MGFDPSDPDRWPWEEVRNSSFVYCHQVINQEYVVLMIHYTCLWYRKTCALGKHALTECVRLISSIPSGSFPFPKLGLLTGHLHATNCPAPCYAQTATRGCDHLAAGAFQLVTPTPHQRSVNIFSKGPGMTYLRLCRQYGLCHNYPVLLF